MQKALSKSTIDLPSIWSVQALCQAITKHLSNRFDRVQVQGEVSGCIRASSGHYYFSLKDEYYPALIRCVCFKRLAQNLDFQLRDGMLVQLGGHINIYEARGDLQLIAEQVILAGEGAWLERFIKQKKRLEAEGLFAMEHKRPIKPAPRAIGIVTSLKAAALQDVIITLKRRVPHIPVYVTPALVQGEEAVNALVIALNHLQKVPGIDIILLIRGGGSMEDLWAFNEEPLVRAIAKSQIPVICGVGHETDFTLCDFAADLRAPTPTAAAELAAIPLQEWLDTCHQYQHRMLRLLSHWQERSMQELDYLEQALQGPEAYITRQKEKLNDLERQWRLAWRWQIQEYQRTIEHLATKLSTLNPEQVFNLGYAMLQDKTGKVIHSIDNIQPGQHVQAKLIDGKVDLQCLDIMH
jgi:exodeoxyribonuclease VII large subunit